MAHVGTPVVSAVLKPGSYVTIPIPTDRGRSIIYVATVCSIKDNQIQVKFLRNTENAGVYRDADDDDTSVEDIKNVLFGFPEPQVKMVGTARLQYTHSSSLIHSAT